MAGKNRKVIRLRRRIRWDIGMIIFLVFFIYLAYNVVAYMTRSKLKIYEVGTVNSVVKDSTYDGLILRSETVHLATESGYVNYYVREGSRASVGDTICSLDKNNQFATLLENGTGESSLSAEQLSVLKKKLTAFSVSYRPEAFDAVYDLRYTLDNLLLEYFSSSSLDELEAMGIDTNSMKTVEADISGVVEYYCDGYEEKTEDQLTAEDLSSDDYVKNQISSGTSLEKDAALYKTVTSESWSVYLPLSREDQSALAEVTKLPVTFNDINLNTEAAFSLVTLSDGTVAGKCTFTDYMIQLADLRYTSVTIRKSDISSLNKTGLKIPKSAVITKDFYVVPASFAANGGNNSDTGFYAEEYTADGTKAEFITPAIYAQKDGYLYLNPDDIESGTVLRKPSDELSAGLDETSAETETQEETQTADDGEETSAAEETEESETGDEDSQAEETEPTSAEEETSQTEEETLPAPDEDADTCTVAATAALQGVACVNKGYVVFKQITILDENDDYYIVETGQDYGLAVYDHILLEGDSAAEGEIIYQ